MIFLHVTGYLSSEENRHITDIVSEICENLLSFDEIFNIECMIINIQRLININMHVVGYKETMLSALFCKYTKDMITKFKLKTINICIKPIYSHVHLYMYMFEHTGYSGIRSCNHQSYGTPQQESSGDR